MEFIVGEIMFAGVCLDISKSGLRGTFSLPIPVGSEGLLTLHRGDRSYQVHARVYSLREGEARIRFRSGSEQEELEIRELLNVVAKHSQA